MKTQKLFVIDLRNPSKSEAELNAFWKDVADHGYETSLLKKSVVGDKLICSVFVEVSDTPAYTKTYTKAQKIVVIDPENVAAAEAELNAFWKDVAEKGYKTSRADETVVDGKLVYIVFYEIPEPQDNTTGNNVGTSAGNDTGNTTSTDDNNSAGNFID